MNLVVRFKKIFMYLSWSAVAGFIGRSLVLSTLILLNGVGVFAKSPAIDEAGVVDSASAVEHESTDAREKSAVASEIFRTQIYPYVLKNCSACHGDGKSDIEYAAPNWLYKGISATEKQVQGYLRGGDLSKTKIYSQVKSKHWSKTSPADEEKEYGEQSIENFSAVFGEYFKALRGVALAVRANNFKPRVSSASEFAAVEVSADFDEGSIIRSIGANNKQLSENKKLNILQVTSGDAHSCVLFENGRVKCWGENDYGQLGLGDRKNRGRDRSDMGENLPYVDLGKERVIQMSAGYFHNCALFENSRVKCWGKNTIGQLGLGDQKNRGLERSNMGENLPYVDLGKDKVTQISSGGSHTCVLFENNRIKCWGENIYGQLGLGEMESRGLLTIDMGENLPYVNLGKDKVTQISAGLSHVCALFENGRAKCWGNNDYGKLGLGDQKNRGHGRFDMGENLAYVNLGKEKIIQISGGTTYTCALFENSRVKCLGHNVFGQLGLGDSNNRGESQYEIGENLPYVDLGKEKVIQVSTGYYHVCVLLESGHVKCWGNNEFSQAGASNNIKNIGNKSRSEIVDLKNLSLGDKTVNSISTGRLHTCVANKEKVFCFGYNNNGQLGQGTDVNIAPGDNLVLPEYHSIVQPTLLQ